MAAKHAQSEYDVGITPQLKVDIDKRTQSGILSALMKKNLRLLLKGKEGITFLPECKKTKIIKAGIATTRKGKKQKYQCKGCARIFYLKGR